MAATKLLSQKQVAEKLSVSQRTIIRWVKARSIPYLLINGIKKFDEQKIDNWLSRKEVRMKSVV